MVLKCTICNKVTTVTTAPNATAILNNGICSICSGKNIMLDEEPSVRPKSNMRRNIDRAKFFSHSSPSYRTTCVDTTDTQRLSNSYNVTQMQPILNFNAQNKNNNSLDDTCNSDTIINDILANSTTTSNSKPLIELQNSQGVTLEKSENFQNSKTASLASFQISTPHKKVFSSPNINNSNDNLYLHDKPDCESDISQQSNVSPQSNISPRLTAMTDMSISPQTNTFLDNCDISSSSTPQKMYSAIQLPQPPQQPNKSLRMHSNSSNNNNNNNNNNDDDDTPPPLCRTYTRKNMLRHATKSVEMLPPSYSPYSSQINDTPLRAFAAFNIDDNHTAAISKKTHSVRSTTAHYDDTQSYPLDASHNPEHPMDSMRKKICSVHDLKRAHSDEKFDVFSQTSTRDHNRDHDQLQTSDHNHGKLQNSNHVHQQSRSHSQSLNTNISLFMSNICITDAHSDNDSSDDNDDAPTIIHVNTHNNSPSKFRSKFQDKFHNKIRGNKLCKNTLCGFDDDNDYCAIISNCIDDMRYEILDLNNKITDTDCMTYFINHLATPNLFSHISQLDLSNNSLTSLSSLLFLKNLDTLLLNNNNIISIPPAIQQCSNLTNLNLSFNHLHDLPAEFANLPNLQILNLDSNKFNAIPTTLQSVKTLKTLYIVNNPRLYKLNDTLNIFAEHVAITIHIDNAPLIVSEYNASNASNITVAWNSVYPDKIIDKLYIGSIRSTFNEYVYRRCDISSIYSMGRELNVAKFKYYDDGKITDNDSDDSDDDVDMNTDKKDYVYYHVNMDDTDTEKFDIAILDNIHQDICNGNGCLVHCQKGISRSGTTVIAYLMVHCHMSLDDAFVLAKKMRSEICPNPNFMAQLQKLDKDLFAKKHA